MPHTFQAPVKFTVKERADAVPFIWFEPMDAALLPDAPEMQFGLELHDDVTYEQAVEIAKKLNGVVSCVTALKF